MYLIQNEAVSSELCNSTVHLQRAGQAGAVGPSAVTSVEEESRSAAGHVNLRMASVKVWSRKDGPVTPSPALVSAPFHQTY